jgi:hypothetical protein
MDIFLPAAPPPTCKNTKLFSGWIKLVTGMPQVTWLGSLSSIVLINDLELSCLVHKVTDDTTLTEILAHQSSNSDMSTYVRQLLD